MKCYNEECLSKILRQLDVNEGVFILPWNPSLFFLKFNIVRPYLPSCYLRVSMQ